MLPICLLVNYQGTYKPQHWLIDYQARKEYITEFSFFSETLQFIFNGRSNTEALCFPCVFSQLFFFCLFSKIKETLCCFLIVFFKAEHMTLIYIYIFMFS
ncbi:hypothetical protein CIPAW_16G107000 [Carya illinoinensis]|uniref:Uncharacterized protein n=1 Tax=Carya illinoinensis TaxID=32201 RepID=A0A8T1N945_CARIL|nr:hypothetical protein CIPAW_16G107000 [Carya illinoinensis]